MSTYGVIARKTSDTGFAGREHYYDSYPSHLGRTLWRLYHTHFNGDLEKMLTVLIDDHPAGWSTIIDCDFSLAPGFINRDKYVERTEYLARPRCFCHGDRDQEAFLLTHRNVKDQTRWAYIFSVEEEGPMMEIRHAPDETRRAGIRRCLRVCLHCPEPDWQNLEFHEVRNV